MHDHWRQTGEIKKSQFSTLKPRTPKDFQHFAFKKEEKDQRESLQYNKAQEKDHEMIENDGNPNHLFNLYAVNPQSKRSLLTWLHQKHNMKRYGKTSPKRTERTISASTPHNRVFAYAVTVDPILLVLRQTALTPGLSLRP